MQSSFRQGLRIQLRVLHALMLREMLTRYGRHNLGFLWLFIEPMMFTLAVVALWTALGRDKGASIPIIAFGITGYSTIMLWRNMPGRAIGSIAPNAPLLTHRPVQMFDVFTSRIVLEAIGATVSFAVLAFGAWMLGLMHGPEDVLKVLGGWFLLAWFSFAVALWLGAASERSGLVYKIWAPVSYIFIPLSGAFFLLEALPPGFREIVMLLPIVHCVELVRDGYFGSLFNAYYDIGYVMVCNVVLTLFALSQVRDISRRGLQP
jgi:ABC-type polysaccharide/polyol phosphate export permease